jgi:hypothetical protein
VSGRLMPSIVPPATPAQHCLACQIADELAAHRDSTATDWSVRRAALNFAVIIARTTCPDYVPASTGTDD